jgi:adenylate cyclase
MATARVERRLTAIFAADVVGYSRLTSMDEEGTHVQLKEHLRALVAPNIHEHRGHVVKNTGDGMLAEFSSVVDAVRCALDVQRGMTERNADMPREKRIEFRIGINVGDVIIDDGDIFGDGVNVAVRLEGIAEPGGICVSGPVREYVQGRLDATLEDAGEQKLKNIDRPVRVYRVQLYHPTTEAKPVLDLPDKPSIAVLPFTNMSGDSEQEYFSDGVAEDIITMLSRSLSLSVVARNSSFTYKGRMVGVKQIACQLGVRYVLEGSVRRGGNRVRVTAQLIDAETGNQLWAERYDRAPTDIFAVQDEITEAVVIAIVPAVAERERRRAARKPPESLSAWEAYQRGLWHHGRIGPAENDAAQRFYRRSIDLDPNFAPAYAALASAIRHGALTYQTYSIAEAVHEGLPLAQKAISLDPMDAAAHTSMGWGLMTIGDHDGMLAEGRKALAINPNFADAHFLLGAALQFSGRPREALESIRKAIRFDPQSPTRYNRMLNLAIAYYFLREYEAAVNAAKEVLRVYSDHPQADRYLAAALGQAGHSDEARRALQRAIALSPKSFDMFVQQRPPWYRPTDHEHMLEGLRKAGWEG